MCSIVYLCMVVRDFILIINRGLLLIEAWSIVDCVMDLGAWSKTGVVVGGGGLTWTLILRIFRITFFASPS